MKIETDGDFHLTYCTNIHPGEAWKEVFANLQKYVPQLKAQLSPNKSFAIGLRLANIAAQELLERDTLIQFQAWLSQHDVYVFTLNGFPYGSFHHQVVKDKVYAPDWSQHTRLDYTLRLAKILAVLLPPGIDGGISTLPLSYKPWLTKDKTKTASVLQLASHHLAVVVAEMVRIQDATGKLLHIDLEPEPDGLIENAAEVVDFFTEWLLPIGGVYLAVNLGISQDAATKHLLDHVRVCYDTCHFAVEYEQPATVFARWQAAGIQIGKIQISAAMQVILSEDSDERSLMVERLRPFAESTYLHQVIERRHDGTLAHYLDLATALPELARSTAQEWRIHFHVPIFIRDYHVLHSTQDDITSVLRLLQSDCVCKHLEIETYTWDVLPPEMKMDLPASIQREYEWVLARFATN